MLWSQMVSCRLLRSFSPMLCHVVFCGVIWYSKVTYVVHVGSWGRAWSCTVLHVVLCGLTRGSVRSHAWFCAVSRVVLCGIVLGPVRSCAWVVQSCAASGGLCSLVQSCAVCAV